MKRSDIALAVVGGVRVQPATSSGASVRTNKTSYSTKSGSYTMSTSFSENIRFGKNKKKDKKDKKEKSSKSADRKNSEDRASRASISSSSSFMRRRLSVSTVGSVTSSFHAPPPSESESTDQNPQLTSENSMSEQSQASADPPIVSGEEKGEQQQQDDNASKPEEPANPEPNASVTKVPPQPAKLSIPTPPESPAFDPCDRPISDVGDRRTMSDAACKAVDGRLATMPQLRAECRSESSAGTGQSGIRDNIRPASPAPGEEKIEHQHYMTASKGSGPIIITNGALPPPKRILGFRQQTYVVAPESPTQAPVKSNSSSASPSVSPPASPVVSGSASTTSNDDRLAGLLRSWRRRERDRAASSGSAATSTFKKPMEDVPEVVGPYPVFGIPLEQAVSLNVPWWPTDILAEDNAFDEQICDPEYQHFVPLVVLKCIKFIVRYGLDEEGIFRISGSSAQVAALREKFIKGKFKPISLCL
uniref:ARAD1C32010p n=1 Tax=Blastobotrys adeninivorans TaxID=409370 RepID=A0A060T8T7_BLAAD